MGSGGRWYSADSVEEMGGALAAHCDVTNSTESNNAPGLFTVRANPHLTEMLESKVELEKSEVVSFGWLSCQAPPFSPHPSWFSSFCCDVVVITTFCNEAMLCGCFHFYPGTSPLHVITNLRLNWPCPPAT